MRPGTLPGGGWGGGGGSRFLKPLDKPFWYVLTPVSPGCGLDLDAGGTGVSAVPEELIRRRAAEAAPPLC